MSGMGRREFVALLSGANMNFDRLRFVAERAEVGEEREALFAVTIPEERGSFKRFCGLIGPRSVTEFNYRISDEKQAHVFVGIATSNRGESQKIARSFERHGFPTIDLTHDELAKEHVRHMVGGRSELAHDERLYRFIFPERPGALRGVGLVGVLVQVARPVGRHERVAGRQRREDRLRRPRAADERRR